MDGKALSMKLRSLLYFRLDPVRLTNILNEKSIRPDLFFLLRRSVIGVPIELYDIRDRLLSVTGDPASEPASFRTFSLSSHGTP
jgi:hypothetical protein